MARVTLVSGWQRLSSLVNKLNTGVCVFALVGILSGPWSLQESQCCPRYGDCHRSQPPSEGVLCL